MRGCSMPCVWPGLARTTWSEQMRRSPESIRVLKGTIEDNLPPLYKNLALPNRAKGKLRAWVKKMFAWREKWNKSHDEPELTKLLTEYYRLQDELHEFNVRHGIAENDPPISSARYAELLEIGLYGQNTLDSIFQPLRDGIAPNGVVDTGQFSSHLADVKSFEVEIMYLGKRTYKVAGHDSVIVNESSDTVLQAFLEENNMDYPRLIEKAGFDKAPRILSELPKKFPQFAPAIRLPKGKGKGGYHVKITSLDGKGR
jgi:hypothetical protein